MTTRDAEHDGKPLRVAVFDSAAAATAATLGELRHELTFVSARTPLIGFATGGTFAVFLALLAHELQVGRLPRTGWSATHLDEYLGFAPDEPGGMVHELLTACPPLAAMHAEGRCLLVPSTGTPDELRAHEAALRDAGGTALQLLGIGRNGHVAFNEPGTPFDRRFHRAALTPQTRADARARFPTSVPPREAVTAGPQNLLEARRLVLVATGAAKAPAVRAMLEGPIDPACPASLVRLHRRASVLLDQAAAAQLTVDHAFDRS